MPKLLTTEAYLYLEFVIMILNWKLV